jgi:hypothetical protein
VVSASVTSGCPVGQVQCGTVCRWVKSTETPDAIATGKNVPKGVAEVHVEHCVDDWVSKR